MARTAGDSEEVRALAVRLRGALGDIVALNGQCRGAVDQLQDKVHDQALKTAQDSVDAVVNAILPNMKEISEVCAKLTSYAQFLEDLDKEPGAGVSAGAGASAGPGTSAGGTGNTAADPLRPSGTVPRSLDKTQFGFSKQANGHEVYDSPLEMDRYLYGTQGMAYTNVQGTCGLCSIANILRLAGAWVGEKEVVDYAMSAKLCVFDKDDADRSGGTNAEMRADILEHFGISSHMELVDMEGGKASDLTLDSIADHVSSGHGVIISVDAGHFYNDMRYLGGGHAVTVTSVERTSSGEIAGYYICDSNQGTIFVKKSHLQKSLRGSAMNITDTVIR